MSIIAYIRVSSNKQTLEHQQYEIEQFAQRNNIKITHWVKETISSRKKLSERELGGLLKKLRKNDILIACEISRFGRSLLEIMGILEYCLNKKIQIWTVKENYRLGNDIQSKVMAFAFGLAAEIERNLISQRTKASLENLKAQGIKLGRPNKSKIEDAKFKSDVEGLCGTGMSIPDIALKLKIARSTLYRFFQLSRNKED